MKTRAATASLLLFVTALTVIAAVFGPTWRTLEDPASSRSDRVQHSASAQP